MQLPGNTVSDASGNASIQFVPRSTRTCRVNQVSTAMRTAPSSATCELQLNGRYVTTLVAQGDVADGDPPILVTPTDTLAVVWTGAGAGVPAEALFFFEYV